MAATVATTALQTKWCARCTLATLRHIFTHLPSARSLADYEALLPWNLDRAKIMLATVEAGD